MKTFDQKRFDIVALGVATEALSERSDAVKNVVELLPKRQQEIVNQSYEQGYFVPTLEMSNAMKEFGLEWTEIAESEYQGLEAIDALAKDLATQDPENADKYHKLSEFIQDFEKSETA